MNELSPTISVDIGLKKFYDSVEIDSDVLVTYMQERGISDDDIPEVTVNLSADLSGSPLLNSPSPGKQYNLRGHFFPRHDLITVYASNHAVEKVLDVVHAVQTSADNKITVENYDGELAQFLSETIAHEVEHKALKNNPEAMEENYKYWRAKEIRHIGKALIASSGIFAALPYVGEAAHYDLPLWGRIGVGLSAFYAARKLMKKPQQDYASYRNQPEELLCRATEAIAPENLIRVVSSKDLLRSVHLALEKL